MQEITLRTERRTQLVDITQQVQQALSAANGAAAALVYVPHTTAAVTINEGADPAVARDLESALEKVVDDGWDWKHVEDPDGPNAPSHIRASLISPQILVPLNDGKLALGTWQGIFFCEFDGPRAKGLRHGARVGRDAVAGAPRMNRPTSGTTRAGRAAPASPSRARRGSRSAPV